MSGTDNRIMSRTRPNLLCSFILMIAGLLQPFNQYLLESVMLPQNTSNTLVIKDGQNLCGEVDAGEVSPVRLPDDKDYNGVLPQFMTFTEQFRGIPGDM